MLYLLVHTYALFEFNLAIGKHSVVVSSEHLEPKLCEYLNVLDKRR